MSHPKRKKPLNIKKYWPLVSVLLFLSILASSLLWPQAARPLAWTVLCLGLGLAIFATIRRDVQTPRMKPIAHKLAFLAFVEEQIRALLPTVFSFGEFE